MDVDKIYNIDCLAGMEEIPAESIDCIITDLPYGTTKNAWDSVIPLDRLWAQYKRIIKQNGAVVLFAQTPFDKVLGASNLEMLKYEWIWAKECGTGHLNANFAPLKIHENILVFSKSAAAFVRDAERAMTYNPQFSTGKPYATKRANHGSKNYDWQHFKLTGTTNDGSRYYPTDVLNFKHDAEKIHPTQKPVNLLRYLVRTYSNPGDMVLDSCMGSGTTAVACIMENRHFIGFETSPEYFEKANNRIQELKDNPVLF